MRILPQLRRYWRPIVLTRLAFTLLGVALLTPLFGALLQGLVSLSGSAAVADQDIARLLLTPLGMVGGIFLVALFLALSGLEIGAQQFIALAASREMPVTALQATLYSLRHTLPLLRLTLWLTLRVLAYLLPWLAAIGAMAWFLLREHDINYYLSQRPAEFYYALAAAVLLSLPLVWLLGRRLLGWCLVLPLLLFSNMPAAATFAHSERLTSGRRGQCLRALLGWLVLAIALAAIPALFLDAVLGGIVTGGGDRLALLALLLGAVALTWGALGFFASAIALGSFTLLIGDLYGRLADKPADHLLQRELREAQITAGRGMSAGRLTVGLLCFALLAAGAGLWLLRDISVQDSVLVVAHRGAAGAAPENTMAAFRRAIEDRADWIELDVQESRDGEVVVVHDSDFMKLAGVPLKVWDGDLAEIGRIDVGSWY